MIMKKKESECEGLKRKERKTSLIKYRYDYENVYVCCCLYELRNYLKVRQTV